MKWILALAATFAATLCAGCASHRLGPGSVDYNLAVERERNGELLLNIVRASQHRPMAFTVLQTITGTGAAAQSTFDLPIIQNHADMALSLEQKLTGSGQPSFTVGVLDTQEFYRGILTPLTVQTLDLYLKRGLSKPLLMDLFFSNIGVAVEDGGAQGFQAEFRSDPEDPDGFSDYQAVAALLLSAGLSTEAIKDAGGSPDYVLCFRPTRPIAAARDLDSSTCEALARRTAQRADRRFQVDLSQTASGFCDLINRRRIRGAPLDCSRQTAISLTFAMRSTYEMIQYAGAALRQSRGGRPPIVTDRGQAEPLILVQAIKSANPFAAVRYGQRDYSIPAGEGPELEPTLQTFQLLIELTALNRSAKDLPASSVTVVTP